MQQEYQTAKILQQALDYAIGCGATDIHMTNQQAKLRIDFRVNGAVTPYLQLSSGGEEVIRRIKALARMDVTDRTVPQEGVFSWDINQISVRVRVASVPVYNGESLALRLLRPLEKDMELCQISLNAEQLNEVIQLLEKDSGLVVIAGRTGTGKTTTLYAMMRYLAERGRQVFSIEDPVEVPIPNCRQIEIREQTGFTYEVGLKALLRQDPDVLMIGEIRDAQTARVALRAALTGRLVLATTHASTVRGCVGRLCDLGISMDLLSEILSGIVIQSAKHWTSVLSIEQSKGNGQMRLTADEKGSKEDTWRNREVI